MLDGAFVRGTTPTHVFPLPNSLTVSDLDDFSIVYRQKNKNILIKEKSDIDYNLNDVNAKSIVIKLSQSETFMFDIRIKLVQVQLKGRIGQDVIILGTYTFRLEEGFDDNEL